MRNLGPLTLGLTVALTGVVLAGGRPRQAAGGPQDYSTYCQTCHGVGGKGDGQLAKHLRKRPADLTRFAKDNDGKFPEERVFKAISGFGRGEAAAGSDMPAWHDVFSKSHESASPAEVKARIESLVRYIETIQAKK